MIVNEFRIVLHSNCFLRSDPAPLPTSYWALHPDAASLIGHQSEGNQQLTIEFKQAVQHLRQQDWQSFSDSIVRDRLPETLAKAQRVKAAGLAVVKEFAAKLKYKAEKICPEVWRLSVSKRWGKISADLDFESVLQLTYSIYLYDSKGAPLRPGDHYLGVLGIAPSLWSISSVDECREKVLKACDFVHWHVNEYVALMDTL